MKKMRIRWNPSVSEDTISKICCRFNIDYHPTINGITPVEIADEDMDLFLKTRDYGHFSICNDTGS